MRVLILHKTTPHWESGAQPPRDLVERVRALIGDFHKAGIFVAGEGLRPSAEGVRVTFAPDGPQVVRGPLTGVHELPSELSIVRAASIDGAVAWAAAHTDPAVAPEADIRPVTEPWDIGLGSRPANLTTRRFMVVRKATRETEAGHAPSRVRAERSPAADATPGGVEHLGTETLRPSARGRRYRNTEGGLVVRDGPFTESKEMVGGYVIVAADSLDAVDPWTRRYIEVVGAEEVDVRELV